LSQFTRLADRQTDGQNSRPRLHSMQLGKNAFASVAQLQTHFGCIQSPLTCLVAAMSFPVWEANGAAQTP